MPLLNPRRTFAFAALLAFPLIVTPVRADGEPDRGDTNASGSAVVRAGTISAEAYRSHIALLASDALEGRGIGTEGIEKAADYIAGQFKQSGLKPGGVDGTWFQPFELDIWRRIGDKTALEYQDAKGRSSGKFTPLAVKEEFTLLPMTGMDKFSGELAFVGYGITNDEENYDDYADIDVKDKVVLMFRYEPAFMLEDPDRPNQHTTFAQFQVKAEHARKHEAVALLIVNPKTSDDDKDELSPFERHRLGNTGMPLMQITRRAADRLLSAGGLPDTVTLQKKIEKKKKPASALLEGVSVRGETEIIRDGPKVKNVIGMLPGEGPDKDEIIVIGGHFDHLGNSPSMWNPLAPAAIHNGADDNASGTAGVLEIAKLMGGGPRPNRTLMFMTFTAEESGLLGSAHFCNNPTVPLDRIVAMLNMDMIGRLRKDSLQVGGMKTGDGFEKTVYRLAKEYGFKIQDGGGGRGPSDHSSFYGKDIPVLFMFTGLHPQYHRPEDDVELINPDGGARIAQMTADIAYEIAARPERPEFSEDNTPINLLSPSEDGAATTTPRRRGPMAGRGPRLGILPDDTDTKPGVLLANVFDDTPASRAGMQKGDRIMRIGDRDVDSLSDLREAISKLEGKSIEMTIERKDKRESLTVTFGGGRDADRRADAGRDANPHGRDTPGPSGPSGGETSRSMPRARLGIAPSYGGSDGEGFKIEYVSKDGPAAKAGIKDCDRILSINEHKVSDIDTYMNALAQFKPGDEVTVTVLREGERVEVKVKLEGQPTRQGRS